MLRKSRLLKFGFLHFLLSHPSPPLRWRLQAAFRFHFRLRLTGVEAWPPVNHVLYLFICVSSTSQITHPSNRFEQSIHTSINDPFNDRTRQMFRFLFISSPAVSSWFFYPFSFLSAPIYSFRCTVRAPVIVYH